MKNKNRIFVITEHEADVIRKTAEMTHWKFVNGVGRFLDSLMQDPIHSEPCYTLCINGLGKNELLKQLVKRGIVRRESRIDDKKDGKPVFKVKYIVPKDGFMRKLNRFYMDMFGENVDLTKGPVNEDGECGAFSSGGDSGMSGGPSTGGGATSCSTIDGGGAGPNYVMPLFGIVRREGFYNSGEKKKKKKSNGNK